LTYAHNDDIVCVLNGGNSMTNIREQTKIEALVSALKLECTGLKMLPRLLQDRGMSASAICRKDYGLKGNKQEILEQMEAMI